MIEYIPGLAGVPATESSISSIDGKNGILAYRGYSIEDLVKYASFEEVAMLLKIIKVFKNTLNTKINHSATLFADKKRQ
jgi:citrate synthase